MLVKVEFVKKLLTKVLILFVKISQLFNEDKLSSNIPENLASKIIFYLFPLFAPEFLVKYLEALTTVLDGLYFSIVSRWDCQQKLNLNMHILGMQTKRFFFNKVELLHVPRQMRDAQDA